MLEGCFGPSTLTTIWAQRLSVLGPQVSKLKFNASTSLIPTGCNREYSSSRMIVVLCNDPIGYRKTAAGRYALSYITSKSP